MKTKSQSIAQVWSYEEQYDFEWPNEGCAYAGKTLGCCVVYLATPDGDQEIFSAHYIEDPDHPDSRQYITEEQWENIIQTEHDSRNHTPWVHNSYYNPLFEI